MRKNTFGKTMPRALTQQLQLMGEQIMLARKRRHLSMQDMDVNTLLQASGSYMLEQQEAKEIIEQVRTAIKDWRTTATELQISHKILESYCSRWDNL